MFRFSKNSEKKLRGMEKPLQDIFRLALKLSDVDFGISEGHRAISRQKKLYAQGRTEPGDIVTNIDGVKNLSDHNYKPARAGDIYAYVNGQANYDDIYMMYLGGVITAAAKILELDIKWGGNWDGDGVLLTDQNLKDAPHYSIILLR